jgi:hypothetical protein
MGSNQSFNLFPKNSENIELQNRGESAPPYTEEHTPTDTTREHADLTGLTAGKGSQYFSKRQFLNLLGFIAMLFLGMVGFAAWAGYVQHALNNQKPLIQNVTFIQTSTTTANTTSTLLRTRIQVEKFSYTITDVVTTITPVTVSYTDTLQVGIDVTHTVTETATPTITDLAQASCSDLANEICANGPAVPTASLTGDNANCENIWTTWYCGMIEGFIKSGWKMPNKKNAAFCGNMEDFCKSQLGIS